MQSDDHDKKAKPMRTKKKSEGWREREESRAAGVTPLVSGDDEHQLVNASTRA